MITSFPAMANDLAIDSPITPAPITAASTWNAAELALATVLTTIALEIRRGAENRKVY